MLDPQRMDIPLLNSIQASAIHRVLFMLGFTLKGLGRWRMESWPR
jgi:hypothetical protein